MEYKARRLRLKGAYYSTRPKPNVERNAVIRTFNEPQGSVLTYTTTTPRPERNAAGRHYPKARNLTEQVTEQVKILLMILKGEMGRQEIQDTLRLSHRENFRSKYLNPALELGLIEMTIPDKPNSRSQKYRLTELGKQLKTLL